jgi:hypothetical protein
MSLGLLDDDFVDADVLIVRDDDAHTGNGI